MKNTALPAYVYWIPVVAALGASFLTGLFGWVLTGLQHRREQKAARNKALAATYNDLLARSFQFMHRAQFLREVMRFHGRPDSNILVLLGLRRPIDFVELSNALVEDLAPVTDALSRIWTSSDNQETVYAANRLVMACSEFLEAAVTPNNQGRFAAWFGQRWTNKKDQRYDTALDRISKERWAFTQVVRRELKRELVVFGLEGEEARRAIQGENS